MTKSFSLLLLLLLTVTVVVTSIRPLEELAVTGTRRILTTEKVSGEEVEADVNNHHSIPRESWGDDNNDNNP